MSAPIRPFPPQFAPPRSPVGGTGAPGDAARAAQRAFFTQALNGVQAEAPIAEAAAVAPVRGQAEVQRVAIPAEAPERPVRPGTFLDIKV